MRIIPIIGVILGIMLTAYGANNLFQRNLDATDLPINFVLMIAFGVFLFLFSLSSTRTLLSR